MQVSTSNGSQLSLDSAFAEGGEAVVWSIHGHSDLVAKVFHTPNSDKEAKLKTMLSNAPSRENRLAVTWPTDLLYKGQQFVGYTMPRISDSIPIFHFYNPGRRANLDPQFKSDYPWPYVLHHVAKNLAAAVKQVHSGGHVIGDLNESNVLVNNRALVTLVDADSFQIHGPMVEEARLWPLPPTSKQIIHHNVVGKAEFTAPELQGKDFKSIVRTQAHDNFALSVLIFYLLMEGRHPFAGILRSGASVGRVDLYCMKRGKFPYEANVVATPPPNAPPYEWLHTDIRHAFRRAFVQGKGHPNRRPSAAEWLTILDETAQTITSCSANRSHAYAKELGACPHCEPDALPTPLVDAHRLADWRWRAQVACFTSAALLWQWLLVWLNKGQSAVANVTAEPLTEKVREVSRRSRTWSDFRPQVLKWPSIRFAGKPRWSFKRGWMSSTFVGTLLGFLVGLGAVVTTEALSDLVLIQLPTTLFLVGFGIFVSYLQWPVVSDVALPLTSMRKSRWPRLSWIGGSSMAMLAAGLLGDWVFNVPNAIEALSFSELTDAGSSNIVYWALAAGLLLGFVQALWLKRYLVRGQDATRWTFINAVGWVLLIYCGIYGREWGRLQGGNEQLAGLAGVALGMLVYMVLTALVFGWLARGQLRIDHHLSPNGAWSLGAVRSFSRRRTWFSLRQKVARPYRLRWVWMMAGLVAVMVLIERLLGWLIS